MRGNLTFLGLLFSGYFEEESAANTALEFDPKWSMTCFDSHKKKNSLENKESVTVSFNLATFHIFSYTLHS